MVGRLIFFKKLKSLYLHNGSSYHNKIWQDDARAHSGCHGHTKSNILISKKAYGQYLQFLANVNLCSGSLYAIAVPSVVCLWRWCALLSRLKFSAIFLRHLVPWPSIDIRSKFYGDRPRGTPPSGDLNARGVVKYSDFDIWNAITSKRCKIGGKLVLITNRKSYMGFRLVPKLVTLNDLERRNGPYFALFYQIW